MMSSKHCNLLALVVFLAYSFTSCTATIDSTGSTASIEFPDPDLSFGRQGDPITVTAIPSNLYALSGVRNTLDVLFDIKTGLKAKATERPPCHISIVLDASGSMTGAKLDNSKAAIIDILSKLSEKDRVSLVAYGYDSRAVFKNENPHNPELPNLVRGVGDMGATNLYSGLILGEELITESLKGDSMKRIFLFSDGLVNHGVTNREVIYSKAKSLSRSGISVSAFGIGHDFDQDLMKSISEHGNGDYFYIQHSEEIPSVVDRGLKGLLSLIATDAVLKVRGLNGATVTKIFGHEDLVAGAFIGDLQQINTRQALAVVEFVPSSEGDNQDIVSWTFTYTPVLETVPVTLSGTVNIKFTTNDALAQDLNPVVQLARAVLTISESDTEVLELLKQGKVKEAAQRKEADIKTMEVMKAKAPSEFVEELHKKTVDAYNKLMDPNSNQNENMKSVHYNQHTASYFGSSYHADKWA